MNKHDLVGRIGVQEYAVACAEAWKNDSIEDCGSIKTKNCVIDSEVPYRISMFIWRNHNSLSYLEKLQLTFQIYADMPTYTYLEYIPNKYQNFSLQERNVFWNWVRNILSKPEIALSNPVECLLWFDFFDNPNTVDESWTELTKADAPDLQIQRILIASSPVPFPLKEILYKRLIENTDWHYYIYYSLLYSKMDVDGKFDKKRAKQIFSKLVLQPGVEYLSYFIKVVNTIAD